jgi:hypothetical protein
VQESSLRLRVVRKLKRDKAFELLKVAQGVVHMSDSKESFVSQVVKSGKESLVHFTGNIKEEETDGQNLVERICEIPPAVRSGKEVRRLRLHPEFKL